ncbi:hypothetical protein HDU76_002147, partial [Blyttiomyces sp. JEL0837]
MPFATILAVAATLLSAVTAKRVNFGEGESPFSQMKVAAAAGAPSNEIYDPPANLSILDHGPVMVDVPISIYYIFYEISRIENYAKHVSDPDTKPNRWSIATTYYDEAGHYVNKVLKHGGSVRDCDPAEADMNKVIVSHIGDKEGQFPYDPQGIYALVTAPEVTNWDDQPPLKRIQYGGYHFSYNTTLPDGRRILLNHAYVQSIGRFKTAANLAQDPQGDTGRRVVDFVVDVLHHEIFEALSD